VAILAMLAGETEAIRVGFSSHLITLDSPETVFPFSNFPTLSSSLYFAVLWTVWLLWYEDPGPGPPFYVSADPDPGI
jgi:hypothetical protein